MTWIETRPKSTADEAYREALQAQHRWYPIEYAEQVPGLPGNDADGIVASHSLIPAALHHAFSTFGVLMDPQLPLTRRQHELIATVVSQTNCTSYCSVSHREFLRRATGDAALVAAVERDWRIAPLSDVDRLLCAHAEQIAKDATRVQRSDIQRLRDAGLTDTAILQATQIAAWFCYINRMADALGVGRD
jgi:uncharacterized peroxidase-related enzyme